MTAPGAPASDPGRRATPAPRRRRRLSTRFLLTCAALGAAGAVLIFPLYAVFAVVLGVPLLYSALVGVAFIPGAVAQQLIRRPGAALLVSFVSGVIAALSPYGAWSIVASTLAGLILELPHAATLYRRLVPWLVYAWMAVYGTGAGIAYAVTLDLGRSAEWIPIACVVATAASHVVSVLLARLLAGRLAAVGVARGLRPA